jgi:hypothetical protein
MILDMAVKIHALLSLITLFKTFLSLIKKTSELPSLTPSSGDMARIPYFPSSQSDASPFA